MSALILRCEDPVWGKYLQRASDVRYVKSRKCHCGCQFAVQPSGIKKQACYGEGQAVCQTVVSKKDQWGGLLLKSLLSLSSYKLLFHSLLYNRQWKHLTGRVTWEWQHQKRAWMQTDGISAVYFTFFLKCSTKVLLKSMFSHPLKTWDIRKRCDCVTVNVVQSNCSIFMLELI